MNTEERITRLEQVVLSLAQPTEANRAQGQEGSDAIARDLFVAEATNMFHRPPHDYESVEAAGVALGDFLGKIERGELVKNETGEYVPA